MPRRLTGVLQALGATAILAGCFRNTPPGSPAYSEPLRFSEVTATAGIHFRHLVGRSRPLSTLRTTGSGLAWLDYDGDGWPDLFCVNQAPDDPEDASARGHRLFRNLGDGRFEDVTRKAGLLGLGQDGYGVAVGDYDGDGRPDLYVTCYGGNHLYHNRGDGTFQDVTAAAGVGGPERIAGHRKWSTAAVWLDADGDGFPDLYVANYCDFEGGSSLCTVRGVRTACSPALYSGQQDLFYRNNGNGTFTLRPGMFPIGRRPPGRGLGALAFDADGDGRTDLFVANDGGGNFFFHNLGGRFEEAGYRCGLALDGTGADPAGMGVDAVDYDGDGRVDLALANFQNQANVLYHGRPPLLFEDASTAMGVAAPSRGVLSFGTLFEDLDLDGSTELLFVNGHVQDNVDRVDQGVTHAQRPLLLSYRGAVFVDVTGQAGPALQEPMVGRGLAACDYDHDGAVDFAVSTSGGGVHLWHNESRHGHWVQIELRGSRPNTQALGAKVTVRAGGKSIERSVITGRSYLSDSDRTLTIGLGAQTVFESIEVRWPGGATQRLPGGPADRRLQIRQEQ